MRRRKSKAPYPDPYKSMYEYKISLYLDSIGVEYEYEKTKFEYYISTRKGVCRDCGSNKIEESHIYTPDWFIPSSGVYIESKGIWDGKGRKIQLAMKRDHPDIEIKMLFLADKWLAQKTKKKKYSEYCKLNNIDCAVSIKGIVPDSWL
jgi:hypothetical protein